ncbi:MAG: dipeptide epimerase [Chitinophagaceae bacterium]
MRLRFQSFSLPFRHPFTISKGTKTHQPTLLVALEHLGQVGYGEAPAIAYYDITVDQMIADLKLKKTFIEKFALTDPERYWHYLHHLLPNNPFLVCALDMAAWDLFGKIQGKPLQELWGAGQKEATVLTDYTIGIDSEEKMLAKLREKPWPIYKIKVGTSDDLAKLRAIRNETDAVLRVDANAGWSLETALQIIPALQALGVEMIEQPLAKDAWEDMKKLFAISPIPLFADESCVFEQDVARCEGHFHGINIKLTKCSGLTPARRMIADARNRGLKVMLGCMNESTVGSAAMAHLLPFLDMVDMDGPLLLAEDLAEGLSYDYGRVRHSGRPGLGIILKDLNWQS